MNTIFLQKLSSHKGIDLLPYTEFLHVKSRTHGPFTLFSVSIRKGQNEDEVYAEHPDLVLGIPRACTAVVDDNGDIIAMLEGPLKFTGAQDLDEDEAEEPQKGGKNSKGSSKKQSSPPSLFREEVVSEWAATSKLRVVATEKANGKFVILRVVKLEGILYLLFGSKNDHHLVPLSTLGEVSNLSTINQKLVADVQNYLHLLADESSPLFHLFQHGYSLVGELCDGEHFTDGDDRVKWFGLFRDGRGVDPLQALTELKGLGLHTVESHVAFEVGANPNALSSLKMLAKCVPGEGYVLYYNNVETDEQYLVKTKAVGYILKRMAREKIKAGYNLAGLAKRIADSASYHCLNTSAALRIFHQLSRFTLWMVSHRISGKLLGHMVSGDQPNGFNHYWKVWMAETGESDLSVSPDDLGAFDAKLFMRNAVLYDLRLKTDPCLVVFFQSLQGLGKTTLACAVSARLNSLGIRTEFLEQDSFYGDKDSYEGALKHLVSTADGPKVLLVSRCNANPTQYKGSMQVLEKLHTRRIFIAPDTINPLLLMVALAGIFERSGGSSSTALKLGYQYLNCGRVYEIVKDNYSGFEVHPDAILLPTHVSDEHLLARASSIWNQDTQAALEFVVSHYPELVALRTTLESRVEALTTIIREHLSV